MDRAAIVSMISSRRERLGNGANVSSRLPGLRLDSGSVVLEQLIQPLASALKSPVYNVAKTKNAAWDVRRGMRTLISVTSEVANFWDDPEKLASRNVSSMPVSHAYRIHP